ncbi:MAG: Mov34/MPN/PAD-1 family protein [Oscillospiraceae bacterium]
MLFLNNDIQSEITRHAVADYPNECCGILIGQIDGGNKTVRLVFPAENTADSRKTHFSINPSEILHAEIYAQQNNLEIVGFYHSHPDNEAVASTEDILFMIPGYSYPIISVRNGNPTELRCYTKADNSAVCEEPIKKEI